MVMDTTLNKKLGWLSAALLLALAIVALPKPAAAQDRQDEQQDDPPSRVARLGYMEGSVSFQPAGESEWVLTESSKSSGPRIVGPCTKFPAHFFERLAG
jgi:hypothetical protein